MDQCAARSGRSPMMTDMTAYRKAAAALYSLGEADRQWVLAGLPEVDRTTLSGYLDELASLGFAPVASGPDDAPAAIAGPRQPIEFLRDATAGELLALLDGEPSSLLAQLLAIENWQWTDSFMQKLPPVRQDRIRAALTSLGGSAPARRQYLIDTIGNRVRAGRQSAGPGAHAATKAEREAKRMFPSFLRLVRPWKR